MKRSEKQQDVENRAKLLKELITLSAVACGLNITVIDGKIAFVDQQEQKIVATWEPMYTLKMRGPYQ